MHTTRHPKRAGLTSTLVRLSMQIWQVCCEPPLPSGVPGSSSEARLWQARMPTPASRPPSMQLRAAGTLRLRQAALEEEEEAAPAAAAERGGGGGREDEVPSRRSSREPTSSSMLLRRCCVSVSAFFTRFCSCATVRPRRSDRSASSSSWLLAWRCSAALPPTPDSEWLSESLLGLKRCRDSAQRTKEG
jgi:hypothetical protein